jgi:signal transduction histidine kinase
LLYEGIVAGLGALLVAARFPLLGWRIGYLFVLVVPRLPHRLPINALDATQFFLLLLVFALAGWRHSRAALWWMWAFMLVPVWLWVGPGPVPGLFEARHARGVAIGVPLWWWSPAVATAAISALAVAVDATGAWHRARRRLAAQSERAELEEARRAVLEERARVARELHDVVAHHMSLIAVQTETARYRIAGLPEAALAELASVSSQARDALQDMRRLLGVLRSDARPNGRPSLSFGDIPALVTASSAAGVSTSLAMPQDGVGVSSPVGLCAYRVVQEALANASRHAPGSSVAVRLVCDDVALRVEVKNGPPDAPAPPPGQPGHGLIGMRERVTLLGGSFYAGPAQGGGFEPWALLPLGDGSYGALDHHLATRPS